MSLPNIPNINPEVTLTTMEAVNMILSSVALEGIGLSHIINAEGEKIQHVLGTLENSNRNYAYACSPDVNDILLVNRSVSTTLSGILKNQLVLQLKLENAMELFDKVNPGCSSYPDGYYPDGYNPDEYYPDGYNPNDCNPNYNPDNYNSDDYDPENYNSDDYDQDNYNPNDCNPCEDYNPYRDCEDSSEFVECVPSYME